ncbi:hypothetical protein [Microvirga splendida]|uniref:Uncharacterized protein n=1 Tax=Microvirga splendida TaxID=2795727 RepID=A0ABS0XVI5_9HYPH|nr:hypothetical protein [Microvirga splendida]MBJ6124045.1 hypothetical protein [Microvirga splendida]
MMSEEILEIITALTEQITALEARLDRHEEIWERLRKQMLPTLQEATEMAAERRDRSLNIMPSPEEAYLMIWGVEQFERIWRKSAEPYLKNFDEVPKGRPVAQRRR